MSEFVKQSTSISSGVDKVDWFDVSYSSSFSSKVELSSKYNKCHLYRKDFLFRKNCFEQNLKNQTEMVGTKLRTVQWLGITSSACNAGVSTDRCLNKGLGGNVQWNLNRGDVVCSGNEKPHKCLITFSHKTAHTNVLKNLEAQSHSSPGGQHISFDISVKDGGYPQFKINPISKRNAGSLLLQSTFPAN